MGEGGMEPGIICGPGTGGGVGYGWRGCSLKINL